MSKVTIELDQGTNRKNCKENLTIEQKLHLVRKREKETLSQRWDNLLRTIDEKRKNIISQRRRQQGNTRRTFSRTKVTAEVAAQEAQKKIAEEANPLTETVNPFKSGYTNPFGQ